LGQARPSTVAAGGPAGDNVEIVIAGQRTDIVGVRGR